MVIIIPFLFFIYRPLYYVPVCFFFSVPPYGGELGPFPLYGRGLGGGYLLNENLDSLFYR